MTANRPTLAELVRLHQAGRLAEAEAGYQQILDEEPEQADALHLLGAVRIQLKRPEDAIETLKQATALMPENATFLNTLGGAYHLSERFEEALEVFERALALNPDDAKSLYDQGNALKALERNEEAVRSYKKALRLKPDFAEAWHNLGSTLSAMGRHAEAVQRFRHVLGLKPKYAKAHNGLGLALDRMGKPEEAIACFRRAIELNPKESGHYLNLGVIYKSRGEHGKAIRCYENALNRTPNPGPVLVNLGNIHQQLNNHAEALRYYEEAAKLRPEDADVRAGIAKMLIAQGRYEEAREHIEQGAAHQPERGAWWKLFLASTFPSVSQSVEEIEASRANLMRTLEEIEASGERLDVSEMPECGSLPPSEMWNHGMDNRPIKEAFAAVFRAEPPELAPRAREPRVGFLVTRGHEGVFTRLMSGLLNRISPRVCTPVVLCCRTGAESIRKTINNPRVEYLILEDTLKRMAESIRKGALDVLYFWEVGTDVMNYYLPFLKLAPVQATGWGVQETTGIARIDYYLSSEILEPEGNERFYTEKLFRLRTLPTYQVRVPLPETRKSRADFGLPSDRNIYFCAQRPAKVHPDFDRVLGEILRRDPKGVVALSQRDRKHETELLKARHASTLSDVRDRIVYVPPQKYGDYLCLIEESDVLLDTFEYAGVCTTYDALSLNQPIVTKPGPRQVSGYTAACYREMGVTDCVASSEEEYLEIALRLGTDEGARRALRRKLQDASPALFEDGRVIEEYERALHILIQEARNEAPHDDRSRPI